MRRIWLASAALALVLLVPATTAVATPSKNKRCSSCHNRQVSTSIAVKRLSASGTKNKYRITTGGRGWAVFVGTKKVAGRRGSGGYAYVTVGKRFVVYTATKYPRYNKRTFTAK